MAIDLQPIQLQAIKIQPTKLQVIQLDVSELAMPEPMRQVLQALAVLTPGQCLVIHHRKNPTPLYPKLAELGFVYRVDIDYAGNDSSALFDNSNSDSSSDKAKHGDGSGEDLAVVIKVTFKADESALASFSEMEVE
ncbi:DUF2249 domain-containing protein [Moritella sp. Urea-trap-13]|uniref:DUF2249 domain-containing protein n=1 Tax=Moritella sp. Urea-trap-13 TaxID=2058327 RepID=UPI000C34B156|nr:DUF2249 domain-containing protein [Moritella sp. Urea-trap-13]PKH06989.1 hypothetical protein CXF93_14000 [Moritella sp. Urea-trap-13]